MPLELRYDISRAGADHAFVSLFQIHSEVQAQSAVTRKPVDATSEHKGWIHDGNSRNNDRFAPLAQINQDRANQSPLTRTSRTGDIQSFSAAA